MEIFKFRLKFHWSVLDGPIDNLAALVQVMAWRPTAEKSLSEPVMV